MAKDPYEILGLKKNADDAAIKSAYRKLAKKHHPDLNPGNKEAEAKFKEISAANDLLADKDKRAAFDRGDIDMEGQPRQQQFYREHAQGTQGQRYYQGAQDASGGGASFDPADLEDLFGSFFRSGAGARRPGFEAEPADAHYAIDIDFTEAAKGAKKQVTLPDGRTLDITIPEGIEEGQKLRLKGQGNKSRSGQPGDAYVEVHIRPHPVFSRTGNDIRTEIPIGFHESILGAKVEVPTIHGPLEVTVPKGSGTGATLRLKGKGIKQGDHYVKLKIMMPAKIDEELEQAIRKWSEAHAYNPRKKEGV